jgi:O-antigen ligase
VAVSVSVAVLYAVIQNILFLGGNGTFEIMPGRPNAAFAEPDWLGMFLVLSLAILLSIGYMIASRTESMTGFIRMKRTIFLFLTLTAVIVALMITVSRSAWLGAVACLVTVIGMSFVSGRRKTAGSVMLLAGASVLLSSIVVFSFPLPDFDLSGRVGSVGTGLQTITVSCESETVLPDRIRSADGLESFGCRHIDLEEIDTERSAGRFVTTIERDDPNVSIRKRIYGQSAALGLEHPVLGVGWGTVSGVLGTDTRGTGLNASDVFIEIWLGSGLVGILGFIGFLVLLAVRAAGDFIRYRGLFPLFLISAFSGLAVFDLFNSGILLGFFWALLGIAGSYLFHETDFAETL